MSSAEDQIRNLIHRYSEAVDSGQFEILDELFAHANLRVAVGNKAPGPPRPGSATAKTYRDAIRLYADGTPRTRHLVSNTIIEVDEAAGSASARSYNTTLQQVPGKPITVIATAYYRDAFERIGDSWQFTERVIRHASIDGVTRDFIGDMSDHVIPAPAVAGDDGSDSRPSAGHAKD